MVSFGGGELITELAKEIGKKIVKATIDRGKGWWYYTPQMAAASRAILQRIPLVDFVLEVRDARIPLSSECHLLSNHQASFSKRIIVLNKMDLASCSELKDWVKYFEGRNFGCFGVNAHNKESVKKLLNFIQTQLRSMNKPDHSLHATTCMIVGIPNVGKSALANSLHLIGRISAAEKGKLRHATVSPHPGETKDIGSFKIGSHPNIYVLDTPGILPSEICDLEVCSKLALTGAIIDQYIGESELARYFLAILNLSDEYRKWQCSKHIADCSNGSELDIRVRQRNRRDHTQDFILQNVRRVLIEAISRFDGNAQNKKDLAKLIEVQFTVLRDALWVSEDNGNLTRAIVAAKLLNLYRTGRLGHFTLDPPAYKGLL